MRGGSGGSRRAGVASGPASWQMPEPGVMGGQYLSVLFRCPPVGRAVPDRLVSVPLRTGCHRQGCREPSALRVGLNRR